MTRSHNCLFKYDSFSVFIQNGKTFSFSAPLGVLYLPPLDIDNGRWAVFLGAPLLSIGFQWLSQILGAMVNAARTFNECNVRGKSLRSMVFSHGVGVRQPSVSMVFNGCPPSVQVLSFDNFHHSVLWRRLFDSPGRSIAWTDNAIARKPL